MANRYFTMGNDSLSLLPRAIKSNDRVRATHDDKKDFVTDETVIPKRIFANNIFRDKLRYLQEVKNFTNERDRLVGYVQSKGPAFRSSFIERIINKLDRKIRAADEDLDSVLK